jgi:hypothetical protein
MEMSSDAEISNLNKYGCFSGCLLNGLHPKRNKKIFPNNALIEIPSNHILFQNLFFFQWIAQNP